MHVRWLAILAVSFVRVVLVAGCADVASDLDAGRASPDAASADAGACRPPRFGAPEPVLLRGYADAHAMEPFVTRDGRYLLFNDSNAPDNDTDLQLARHVDDLTFEYVGELSAANSTALDGVASVDGAGTLYFVSLRDYERTLGAIFTATFSADGVAGPAAELDGVSERRLGALNFDAEISADGQTLYLVDGTFDGGLVPASANLVLARRGPGGAFTRAGSGVFGAVNSEQLEYAPATTADERELYFTRLDPSVSPLVPRIWVAVRDDRAAPFCPAVEVREADGFVEGPTLSADERALYYHLRVGAGHELRRLPILRDRP